MSAYNRLIENLDKFIRKYYLNKVIKGALFFVAFSLPFYLLINFLEYKFYFSNNIRLTLLIFLILGVATTLGYWVILPLTKYYRLGKLISHEQAAKIVGDHFGSVQDKLLNILQLRDQASDLSDNSLLLASVEQKSNEIKLVSFPKAIDLSNNKKYLKYALPPLLVLLVLLFADPSLIADSTTRLVNPNKAYEKPMPFSFLIQNESLEVVQFEDFSLVVKTVGTAVPADVFVEIDNFSYKMENTGSGEFSYTVRNVQKDKQFKFISGEVNSMPYELDVLLKPTVANFDVYLDYPAYTGQKDEKITAIGDLFVPTGSSIRWEFDTKNSSEVYFAFDENKPEKAKRNGENYFSKKTKVYNSQAYKVLLANDDLGLADSLSYFINVIQDKHPQISLEVFEDSLETRNKYFIGEGTDDYGINKIEFVYEILDSKGVQKESERLLISGSSARSTSYSHNWNIQDANLQPGEQVVYFFEIWDNDAVNGSKSARTQNMVYKMPTVDEFKKSEDEKEELIKDKLEEAIKDSKRVQKKAKDLKEKLLQKKEADWQDKKELEKLLEEQQKIEEKINDAKEAFEENLDKQEDFNQPSEEIEEKQEKLEEMFEDLLDEEMQKLMEEIQELMEKLDKDEALEKLDDFENSDEDMEKEMERMLELFKQLEMEYEMEQAIEKLEELADKEEELSKESEKGTTSTEELKEKQEELQKEFESLEKDLDKIKDMNKDLEKPMDMDNLDEGNESIKQDMQQSQQELSKQDKKAASKKQKSASDKMREKASSMSMSMQSQQQEQMQEDMDALRQLLENIVGLSFQQEDLMDLFATTTINTPRYVELVQDQFKIENDFQIVEDSLMALSKRLFQIETFIVEKVGVINNNIEGSIADLEERKINEAAVSQQTVMKNLNDLAVMLSDVMKQMQQDMSSMMPGAQMCNKPGGKGMKPSDKISEGQEGLNKQMKEGKEGKEGKGKEGEGLDAKDFAEMAARQAALRKALEAKQKQLREQGKGSNDLQNIIDQMNEQEKQLVNKRLTNEMMKRQEEILTRLLEHEKAEREQEYDEQRKSKSADQIKNDLPPALEEYLKEKEKSLNLYKSTSPNLKPFYRMLTDEYIKDKS